MDPMERFDPLSPEWGYMGRKLFAEKLWTLIPAQGLIAAHIKSLQEWPPRQRAESLSMQKAMEAAMQSLERAPSGMQ
jgi:arylsulfatase